MPRAATLAGLTLDAYTLVSPIGQGGMGSVWLARRSDGRFEGAAAVKLLNASLVGRAGEERFRREGSILARLRHPHIAHLVDAGVSPTGQPYLVLERVEGEPIDRLLREPRPRRRGPSPSLPRRPRGGRPRPRQPDRASGHQAVQRPRSDRRPGEAPRLRHREASRGGIRHRRSDGADPRRRPRAHARVRRAGTGDRRRRDDRDRRVRPRRAPLRSSDRKASGGGVAAIARGPLPVDRGNGASNVPPTPRRPTSSAGSFEATWTRSWRRR